MRLIPVLLAALALASPVLAAELDVLAAVKAMNPDERYRANDEANRFSVMTYHHHAMLTKTREIVDRLAPTPTMADGKEMPLEDTNTFETLFARKISDAQKEDVHYAQALAEFETTLAPDDAVGHWLLDGAKPAAECMRGALIDLMDVAAKETRGKKTRDTGPLQPMRAKFHATRATCMAYADAVMARAQAVRDAIDATLPR